MSKNKTENTVIKSLILLHLSKKLLRCEKVQKLKWHFPDANMACELDRWSMTALGKLWNNTSGVRMRGGEWCRWWSKWRQQAKVEVREGQGPGWLITEQAMEVEDF